MVSKPVGQVHELLTVMIDDKKFKKISKRTLPNVGMSGWMEALADKVRKQGEHI